MNWFKRAAQYRSEVTKEVSPEKQKQFQDKWNTDIPEGYQIIQDNEGNWAVLRPPQYENEPEEQRMLVKTEPTELFNDPSQAKQKIIDQGLTRIGFESSLSSDEDEDWAERYQHYNQNDIKNTRYSKSLGNEIYLQACHIC